MPSQVFFAYLEVCKPRVVLLMIITALVGMLLAQENLPAIDVLILGNLGIALCAFSGAAINHTIDRKIDEKMARTQNRPIPSGILSVPKVIIFAVILGSLGFALLYFLVNPLSAWLTLGALVGYAFIYTGLLKRITSQNIVIGGLAGAMPPLLGWVAVTGTIHPYSWLLVLIIFLWTPPHFWALAIYRKEEYAKTGIPMLVVVFGEQFTKLQIVLYTILMVMATFLPFLVGMSSWIYLAGATCCNIWFIKWTYIMYTSSDAKNANKLFWVSIYYLFFIFIFLLLDHYLYF